MSKLLIVLALALSLPSLAPRRAPTGEREAVERAAKDYVEALYQAKPELIERSVHPALEKMGLYRPDDQKAYRTPGKMTFEQLRDLAGQWNKDGQQGQDLAYEVQVLDMLDVTACVKLTAKWGIDYMHLVKSGDGWKITQILWQSHPPAQ